MRLYVIVLLEYQRRSLISANFKAPFTSEISCLDGLLEPALRVQICRAVGLTGVLFDRAVTIAYTHSKPAKPEPALFFVPRDLDL